MKQITSITLLLSGVIANTLPRWISGIDGDLFCKFQALSIFLFVVSSGLKTGSKVESILFVWASLLAINNLYDEVIGNPLQVGTFEVLFAVSVTIWTIYRLIKCRQNK